MTAPVCTCGHHETFHIYSDLSCGVEEADGTFCRCHAYHPSAGGVGVTEQPEPAVSSDVPWRQRAERLEGEVAFWKARCELLANQQRPGLPTEDDQPAEVTHEFQRSPVFGYLECIAWPGDGSLCGRPADDPVHQTSAGRGDQPAVPAHEFEGDGAFYGYCARCGEAEADHQHSAGGVMTNDD